MTGRSSAIPAAPPGKAGQSPEDMLDSMRRRIDALGLNLSGLTVVTEAATGAYACTPVIAALAGARRVHAVARDTARHGTFDEAAAATLALAARAGVVERLSVARGVTPEIWASCDILTNSGHLRPITRDVVALLPRRAVIALMYEAWEFRGADIDLAACRERNIPVAAVNERHHDVAVFPFLGPLCARQLRDAGVTVRGGRIALLCDNPFAPFIRVGLEQAGAVATVYPHVGALPPAARDAAWDAVVVALDPGRGPALGDAELKHLAEVAPGVPVAQFWGDIDRDRARQCSVGPVWPKDAPGRGHMGILLNALGHEPIVRLQAGGLRAAEWIFRGGKPSEEGVAHLL